MSGTWILDSEGLSQLIREEREMAVRLAVARKHGIRVAVCAMTVLEGTPPNVHPARFAWVLSRLSVEPVTKEIVTVGAKLLREAGGLHGHKYAIDAAVCATALAAERPVSVLTSDPEDIAMLCGPAVTVIKV